MTYAPSPSRPSTSQALAHVNGNLKVIEADHTSNEPLFPALQTVGSDAWFLDFVDSPAGATSPSMTLPALETVGGRIRIETRACYLQTRDSVEVGGACAPWLASPYFPSLTSAGSLWIGDHQRTSMSSNLRTKLEHRRARYVLPPLGSRGFSDLPACRQRCGNLSVTDDTVTAHWSEFAPQKVGSQCQ